MKKYRIPALLLALVLVLMTTACATASVKVELQADQLGDLAGLFGGAAQPAAETPAPTTPTAPTAAPSTQPSSSEASSSAPASEAPVSEKTSDVTPSQAPSGETPASQAPANAAPSTKEEIITYYVTAYNKMATDAKTFTRTYDYTSNYKDIVEVNNNAVLERLAKTLMDQFMKETTTELAGDINSIPPVGVNTLSISPAQIGTATCTDNGGSYVITLTSTGTDDSPEEDCQPGQGSAGVIGLLLRTEDVASSAPMIKFEGLHARYPTGKVVATIDKASGHITNLEYENPCILHFDSVSAVVKISNANLGLLFQQKWTIGY